MSQSTAWRPRQPLTQRAGQAISRSIMKLKLKLCLLIALTAMLLAVFPQVSPGVAVPIAGCSAAQRTTETAVIDIADATCRMLDTQDEPAWVKVTCQVIETGSGIVKTIIVRLPASSSAAKAFRAGVSPAPSTSTSAPPPK